MCNVGARYNIELCITVAKSADDLLLYSYEQFKRMTSLTVGPKAGIICLKYAR